MRITRRFTAEGRSPYAGIEFAQRNSEIRNPDGTSVFRQDGIAVPAEWSSVAVDILAQKYFRKSGVPQVGPDGKPLLDKDGQPVLGGERDARQVFHRLAGCWTHWGERYGYFDTPADGGAFYDELCHMLAAQIAAPNSPQWFNTGLHWAYGIAGPAQGHYYVDPGSGTLTRATSAYERPQPPALLHPVRQRRPGQRRRHHGPVGPRGAHLQVRLGHRLQLLGPPRRERAALRRRQVLRPDVLPQDRRPGGRGDQVGRHHAARGQDGLPRPRPPGHRGVHQLEGGRGAEGGRAGGRLAAGQAPAQGAACQAATRRRLDRGRPASRTPGCARPCARRARPSCPRPTSRRRSSWPPRACTEIDFAEYDTDWDSEAYLTVSGQNSNNSVRVPNAFMEAVDKDGDWELTRRTDGKVAQDDPGRASCGTRSPTPPGPAPTRACSSTRPSTSGTPARRTAGSTPPTRAREYMFLDDTACNLASLNLLKFLRPRRRASTSRASATPAGCGRWCSRSACSWRVPEPGHRPEELRLPHARPGLRQPGHPADAQGIPYDSPRPRPSAARSRPSCTARPTRPRPRSPGTWARSRLRQEPGAHAARHPQPPAGRLQRARRRVRGLTITPDGHRPRALPAAAPAGRARDLGPGAGAGQSHGFRNAQVTVLAPTGTIGLVMDCDTTGIEPDFALVKFKKLAGGGYFKIINQSLPVALRALGYPPNQIEEIVDYCVGRRTLDGAPASTTTRSGPRASTTRGWPRSRPRSRAPSRSSSSSTPGRSARAMSPRSSGSTTRSWPSGTATCSARSASRRPRSRPPTTSAAAP